MIIPVKIERITLNAEERTYTVLLTSIEGLGALSLDVSIREAQAIAGMSGNKVPESLRTYILVSDLVHGLGGKIMCLKITPGEEDNIHAGIDVVDTKGKKLFVQTSVGDGIIIALNQNTPIMVDEKLLELPKRRSLKKQLTKESLKDLEFKLNQAIESENYELAAEIRDRISKKFN